MKATFWALLIGLCPLVRAKPMFQQRQQVIFHDTTKVNTPLAQIQKSESVKTVNITFDDIPLSGAANQTLNHTHFLDFYRFKLVNTTEAVARKFLAEGDSNCASSKPNAIHSVSPAVPAPGIFGSNSTALAASNLSEYFDIRSFMIKPVGPNKAYPHVEINAWEINGTTAINVYSMFTVWFSDGEYLPPSLAEPSVWWPGWGEKVNWIEIKAGNDDGDVLDFCLDNIVLDFHKVEDM